jgi:hypothetical protein
MSASVEVKADRVIAEFVRAGSELPEGARAVVSKAALNIKTEWRKSWAGKFDHAPQIHRSIDYDLHKKGFKITAEIGPRDEPVFQGFLGRILEFGSLYSGPHPGGIPAAEAETPRFEAAVDALIRKTFP